MTCGDPSATILAIIGAVFIVYCVLYTILRNIIDKFQ